MKVLGSPNISFSDRDAVDNLSGSKVIPAASSSSSAVKVCGNKSVGSVGPLKGVFVCENKSVGSVGPAYGIFAGGASIFSNSPCASVNGSPCTGLSLNFSNVSASGSTASVNNSPVSVGSSSTGSIKSSIFVLTKSLRSAVAMPSN